MQALKEVDEDINNEIKKQEIVNKRLKITIFLLLKENPILPLSFNFKGNCVIR